VPPTTTKIGDSMRQQETFIKVSLFALFVMTSAFGKMGFALTSGIICFWPLIKQIKNKANKKIKQVRIK